MDRHSLVQQKKRYISDKGCKTAFILLNLVFDPHCVLAIYLCKRTMQNKTRLELADYEAVSARPFPDSVTEFAVDLENAWLQKVLT